MTEITFAVPLSDMPVESYPEFSENHDYIIGYFETQGVDMYVGKPVIIGDIVRQTILVEDPDDSDYIMDRMDEIKMMEVAGDLTVREPIKSLPSENQPLIAYVANLMRRPCYDRRESVQDGVLTALFMYDNPGDTDRMIDLLELAGSISAERH